MPRVNDVELGNVMSFLSTLRIVLAFFFLASCFTLHRMIKQKNRMTGV